MDQDVIFLLRVTRVSRLIKEYLDAKNIKPKDIETKLIALIKIRTDIFEARKHIKQLSPTQLCSAVKDKETRVEKTISKATATANARNLLDLNNLMFFIFSSPF